MEPQALRAIVETLIIDVGEDRYRRLNSRKNTAVLIVFVRRINNGNGTAMVITASEGESEWSGRGFYEREPETRLDFAPTPADDGS